MRVNQHTFWNVIEAHSSRHVADYGFHHVNIAELSGVERIEEGEGPPCYWISQVEDALHDAVERYRNQGRNARRSVAA